MCTGTQVYHAQTVRLSWKGEERTTLRRGSNRDFLVTPGSKPQSSIPAKYAAGPSCTYYDKVRETT